MKSPSRSLSNNHVGEKEKSGPVRLNGNAKEQQLEKKTSLFGRSKSQSSKPTLNLVLEKNASLVKSKSSNSRSIPSSPTSCYSLPTSFEKFANGIKQQAKIKGLDKATAKLGLVEKASSVRGASPTGKKVYAGSSIRNLVQEIDFGPKALRKSWEGKIEVKNRDNSKLRVTKHDSKPEARSSSVSFWFSFSIHFHSRILI